MAQGRSTKIISTMQWIRTSRLSIKNSLSALPSTFQGPHTVEYQGLILLQIQGVT